MAEPVKWFTHEFTGAVDIEQTGNGTLIALLKSCLIDGFNTQIPTTITYAGGIATATFGTAHGFLDSQIVAVSGCTEPEYNGEFRITLVNSTVITYPVASDPGGAATGSPSVKTAPVGGWVIEHEDAVNHRIALSRTNVNATPYTLVVTNNGNEGLYSLGGEWVATVRIVENYVDLDTYDLVSSEYWAASHRYSVQEWLFVGDDLLFYWSNRYALNDRVSVFHWGDITSYKSGDTGHCVLNGIESSSNYEWDNGEGSYTQFSTMNNGFRRRIATDYSGQTPSGSFRLMGLGSSQTFGSNTDAYPNPSTNEFLVNPLPVYVMDNDALRGEMTGVVQPLEANTNLAGLIHYSVPAYSGTPIIWWLSWSSLLGNSGEWHIVGYKLADWR